MTSAIPIMEKGATPTGTLIDIFKEASMGADMLTHVRNFADFAMLNYPDKGGDATLRDHCGAVAERVNELYEGRVLSDRLKRLIAKAEVHDVLEMKDEQGNRLWSTLSMTQAGVPADIAASAWRLMRKPFQKYLDNIHEIASDPDDTLVKIADLDINMGWNRGWVRNPKESFKHKKQYLYPLARLYLQAVATGRIDPSVTSPIAFAMEDESVPARLKNLRILRKYSSDTADYTPKKALPGVNFMRGIVRFAQPQPALAI
ncbi:MAG TPA: hypothetical protein VIN59_06610 [Alphaproteobacteria bacterium]